MQSRLYLFSVLLKLDPKHTELPHKLLSPLQHQDLLWPLDNLEVEAAGWVVLEETDLPCM